MRLCLYLGMRSTQRVLKCVAVCCKMQRVAVCCSVMQCLPTSVYRDAGRQTCVRACVCEQRAQDAEVTTKCFVLSIHIFGSFNIGVQGTSGMEVCTLLQCDAVCCSVMQFVAVYCSVL